MHLVKFKRYVAPILRWLHIFKSLCVSIPFRVATVVTGLFRVQYVVWVELLLELSHPAASILIDKNKALQWHCCFRVYNVKNCCWDNQSIHSLRCSCDLLIYYHGSLTVLTFFHELKNIMTPYLN